jgi:hypothetical protein
MIGQYDCYDCKTNTNKIHEYYMVTNDVWKQSGVPRRSMLCIGCLEKRIGRELSAADFPNYPINWIFDQSDRLLSRISKKRRISYDRIIL